MKENQIPTGFLEESSPRVLVVVDDEPLIALIRDECDGDGQYDFKVATNAFDAGMLTERFRPHLLVLDATLPGVDGGLVCTRIREHVGLPDTKVVFTSAAPGRRERKRPAEQRPHAYIDPPTDRDSLLRSVEQYTTGTTR